MDNESRQTDFVNGLLGGTSLYGNDSGLRG
jgi:hypothetical protein